MKRRASEDKFKSISAIKYKGFFEGAVSRRQAEHQGNHMDSLKLCLCSLFNWSTSGSSSAGADGRDRSGSTSWVEV